MPMDPLYGALRPFLFLMDPERAHNFIMSGAAWASEGRMLRSLMKRYYAPKPSERLRVNAFGLSFAHPLGLAAGLDKNGVAIDFWGDLGFSWVELGTVTPGQGQPGNDKPRMARALKDRCLVNRMGFNNLGAQQLADRLKKRTGTAVVGANLGKAKLTPLEDAAKDYSSSLFAVWAHADYITVNVSSPNTPGLRDLQAVESLRPLLKQVMKTNLLLANEEADKLRPILLKIAPDLADEDVDRVADLALELGLDGVIATNTTLRTDLLSREVKISGGMSGPLLAPRALALTRRLYGRLKGQIPIVGVGGISSAEDAYLRIRAGAQLLQVYTALVYQGPQVLKRIVHGLETRLQRDGFVSMMDAVGSDG